MVIFGINAVQEAIRAEPARIRRIVVARGKGGARIQQVLEEARAGGIPMVFEPAQSLDRKAGTGRHQGILAEIGGIEFVELAHLIARQPRMLVVADGIEDPNNLGALIRTAEATGVDGLLLPQRHCCGITPAVVKVSAGAAMHLPTARIGNVAQTLGLLKERGYWIVGLDMSGTTEAWEIDPSLALVLLIGGENVGLRRILRDRCDFLVGLPMAGKVASLNLSVAAGVLLYTIDFSRRRKGAADSPPEKFRTSAPRSD